MGAHKTAVIILNWNGKKDTKECLESFPSLSTFPIYLVDNNSEDDSVSFFKNHFPQCRVISNSQNLGFAGGNNIAIKTALNQGFDSVILLNNDTTLSKDSLETFLTTVKKAKFDLASPKIYFYPNQEFHRPKIKSEIGKIIWYAGGIIDWPNSINYHRGVNEYDHGQYDQPESTDFATGCCLYIHSRVFSKIGYLDEGYLAYYEDADFNVRARNKGFSIGYAPPAHIWHKNASSSGGSGSAKQASIVAKSRLRFALKHAPLRAKLALLKQTILSPSS